MRIQVISDLHTEVHDFPLDFLSNGKVGYAPDIDVMILAGDIVCVPRQTADEVYGVFEYLSRKARNLVYVPGNHEYWGWEHNRRGRQQQVEATLRNVFNKLPNIHWLDNSEVTIDGQHFVGGSMWFQQTPFTQIHEKEWKDFRFIDKLASWVYDKNREFKEFALKAITNRSIVVTHHLPLFRSVSEEFQSDPYNIFFVCDMAQAFFENRPRLWVHGHTHESFDYAYQTTRVLCNPFGYDAPKKGLLNNKRYEIVVTEY